MQVSEAIFRQWKKQCLEDHPDQSRKGGIDEKIVHLVDVINSQSDYFTTSSCSGRLICYTEVSELLLLLSLCVECIPIVYSAHACSCVISFYKHSLYEIALINRSACIVNALSILNV